MSKTHGTVNSTSELTSRDRILVCFTLVDITKTGIVSNYRPEIPMFVDDAGQIVRDFDTWNRSRNQQRNFETIIQIIGLRAQPLLLEPPESSVVELNTLRFGVQFRGSHRVWSFRFAVEHSQVFDGAQPLQSLHDDINQVPCISNLKETCGIETPIFITQGNNANIYFETI